MSRVLIIDDHPLLATGLSVSLRAQGYEVEATSGPLPTDVLELAAMFRPDVALVDLMLGGALGSGIDLIGPLRAFAKRVIALTGTLDRMLLAQALEAGADGFVGKGQSFDAVLEAIAAALEGRAVTPATERTELLQSLERHRTVSSEALGPIERLTPKERVVLAALMDGLTAEEIAGVEIVSLATVRTQIRAVLQKLNVRSQLAAVAYARKVGWHPEPTEARPAGVGNHQHW